MDIFLQTIVNLHSFYYLNLWKILSGDLGKSSCTVTNEALLTSICHKKLKSIMAMFMPDVKDSVLCMRV